MIINFPSREERNERKAKAYLDSCSVGQRIVMGPLIESALGHIELANVLMDIGEVQDEE